MTANSKETEEIGRKFKLKLPVEPYGKGRPRRGANGRIYTPEKTKEAEYQAKHHMRAQWKLEPLEGALYVGITFYFKRPKSVKRKYPIVKPDRDNAEKLICDAGNGILWRDDCQIIDGPIRKRYSHAESYIEIDIWEIL